jgi:hypothetical protein
MRLGRPATTPLPSGSVRAPRKRHPAPSGINAEAPSLASRSRTRGPVLPRHLKACARTATTRRILPNPGAHTCRTARRRREPRPAGIQCTRAAPHAGSRPTTARAGPDDPRRAPPRCPSRKRRHHSVFKSSSPYHTLSTSQPPCPPFRTPGVGGGQGELGRQHEK